MSNFKIGVSYGSYIQATENIHEIKKWKNASLAEIPISDCALSIAHSCVDSGYDCALHIPSKELVNRIPCYLNMQSHEQVNTLIKAISDFLSSDFKWKYVVVHYPLITEHTNIKNIEQLNHHYLNNLRKLTKVRNLPLYIENVAVHPMCYKPEDYDWAVSMCDGLCFDIGHAHTVAPILFQQNSDLGLVEQFFNRFRNHIRCIHLYNATYKELHGYSVNTHYPFIDLGAENGFMDIELVTQFINNLPRLDYIVHEPHRDAVNFVQSYKTPGDYYDIFSQ